MTREQVPIRTQDGECPVYMFRPAAPLGVESAPHVHGRSHQGRQPADGSLQRMLGAARSDRWMLFGYVISIIAPSLPGPDNGISQRRRSHYETTRRK
jgi:hypothetical protein